MAQQCLVAAPRWINGVDENAFEVQAFSIDAWEFWLGVIEVVAHLESRGFMLNLGSLMNRG